MGPFITPSAFFGNLFRKIILSKEVGCLSWTTDPTSLFWELTGSILFSILHCVTIQHSFGQHCLEILNHVLLIGELVNLLLQLLVCHVPEHLIGRNNRLFRKADHGICSGMNMYERLFGVIPFVVPEHVLIYSTDHIDH